MAQSSLAFSGRLLTGVAMLAAATTALAESPAPEIISPLVATPIAPPNPVLGADARRHLVYEIVLMDIGGSAIALKKIEVLDANGNAVLATLEGEALAKILRLTGAGKGAALPAGGSGVLFMDVTLAEDAMVPRALKHRFQVAVSKPEGKPSSGNDRDPTPPPPQTQSFIGVPLDVGKPAVVIAPPLKGPRWVVAGGCCDTITYHRGATLPINGTIHVAERYAIDCNRYEVPPERQSAGAGVAGRHPVLAHRLDDRWDIGVGVAQKFPRLATPPRWSEQRTPMVVATVQQDGQEQPVVDVADIEQRCPIQHPQPHGSVESSAPGTRIDFAIGLAPMHRLEPLRSGR